MKRKIKLGMKFKLDEGIFEVVAFNEYLVWLDTITATDIEVYSKDSLEYVKSKCIEYKDSQNYIPFTLFYILNLQILMKHYPNTSLFRKLYPNADIVDNKIVLYI